LDQLDVQYLLEDIFFLLKDVETVLRWPFQEEFYEVVTELIALILLFRAQGKSS